MLTVNQYARIRQLRRDGRTIREIADELNHSSKTILKALAKPEPVANDASRAARVFGPFRGIVEDILTADASASRKQRHTAQQIFRRLVAEHVYPGGYDQVRRYLQRALALVVCCWRIVRRAQGVTCHAKVTCQGLAKQCR